MRYILIILSVILFAPLANGQFNFRELDKEDGLSSTAIYNILEDSRGHMWFALLNGLNRYDGEEIRVFKADRKKGSITMSSIRSILEDQDGNIWVGGREGSVNKYVVERDSFMDFTKSRSFPKISNASQWDLFEDHKGRIYRVSDEGILRGKKPDYNWEQINSVSFYDTVLPFSIVQDRLNKNKIWVGCRSPHLLEIDLLTDSTTVYNLPGESVSNDIYQHVDNNIYAKSSLGFLLQFDTESKTSTFYDIPRDKSKHALQTAFKSEDEIWIANKNIGLVSFNVKSKTFDVINNSFGREVVSQNENLYSLFTDDQDNLWIGTYTHGLLRLQPNSGFFVHRKLPIEISRKLQDQQDAKPVILDVNTIGDRKLLLIKGSKFIFELDLNDNYVSKWRTGLTGENASFHFFFYLDGDLWLSSTSGFWKADVNNRKLIPTKINAELNGYERSEMGRYAFDRDSNIWQLSLAPWGFLKSDLLNNQMEFFPIEKFNNERLNHGIGFWEDKIIATVTGKGILMFDPISKEKEFIIIPDSVLYSGQFSGSEMVSKGNELWLGTYYNGIIIVERINSELKFKRLDIEDGLPTNSVYSLKADFNGDVWGFTQSGLFRVNENKEVKAFYRKHGLINDHLGVLGRPYGVVKRDGSILIQESGFYTYFSPEKLKVNTAPPKARLESLIIEDSMHINNIAFRPSISIGPGQDNFNIKFSCDNLIDPEDNAYRYRMIGLNDNWVSTKTNLASYTNVPPGEYVFELFAANNDGIWSDVPVKLNLTLRPFFWQTIWFKILCVLGFLGIVFSLYKYRLKGIRREEKIKRDFENELVDTEMKALRAQMNPHFMFNSLNSIKSFIARNEPRNATNYLSKFAQLMRLILSNSREPTISLAKEMEAITLYMELEKMRFDNKFEFNIQLAESIQPNTEMIQPLILQPYIENAIWHGFMNKEGKGHLDIRINKCDENLVLEIEDDGIGREASNALRSGDVRKRKSLGMGITSDRLKYFSARSEVEVSDVLGDSGEVLGTLVVIKIPLNREVSV